jgi:hypothetical protein
LIVILAAVEPGCPTWDFTCPNTLASNPPSMDGEKLLQLSQRTESNASDMLVCRQRSAVSLRTLPVAAEQS